MSDLTGVSPYSAEPTTGMQVPRPGFARGEQNVNHLLTPAAVLDIFHSTGPRGPIAERHGCSVQTVSFIRNGKRWAWLTGGTA